MKRGFRKFLAIVLMLAILMTFTNLAVVGEAPSGSGFVEDVFDADGPDTDKPDDDSSDYKDTGNNDTGYICYYCYNCPCYDEYDSDDCVCYNCPCSDDDDAASGGGGYSEGCPDDCPKDCLGDCCKVSLENCPEDCLEYCCRECSEDCCIDYDMIDELYLGIEALNIGEFSALQTAIENAVTTATVIVINDSFPFEGSLIIGVNQNITIVSNDATNRILTLADGVTGRHFIVNGNLTLGANITLQGRGGDVGADTTAQTFPRGGGVYVASGGELTLNGATIYNNRSNEYGGGVDNAGTFTMSSGTISANAAFSSGGGVHNRAGANFTMSGGIIGGDNADAGNIAHVGAGVGNIQGGTFTMNGFARISHNTTQDREILSYRPEEDGLGTHGGGVRNSGTFNMEGYAIISYNRTVHSYEDGAGGGVWQDEGTFTMSGSARINNNSADHHGGGVYINEGSFTMSGNTFINNNSNLDLGTAHRRLYGGGVFVSRNAAGGFTMSDYAQLHNNSTTGYGGGVATQRTFTMSGNAIIHNNEAAVEGGGVFVSQPNDPAIFNMVGGTIHSNTALRGGGVYNANTFTMSGGTIGGNGEGERNRARAGNGGGVFNAATGRATISVGTIRFNTAEMDSGNLNTGNGGGIFTHSYNNLTVSQGVSFSNNISRISFNYLRSIYYPGAVPADSSGGGIGGDVVSTIYNVDNVSVAGTHPLNNHDINFIGASIPDNSLTFHPNGGRFDNRAVNVPITRNINFNNIGDLYNIVINARGTLIAINDTMHGAVPEVPIPTRVGWRFLGWVYRDPVRPIQWITSTTPITDPAPHTMFAHWERIPTTPPTQPEVGGAVDTNIPRTGDDNSMALWLALLSTSLAGGAGLLIWKRKRIFN